MMAKVLAFLLTLSLSVCVLAEPLTPFHASYMATYRGLKADAERSLTALDDDQYQMQTRVSLKLMGQTLTEIRESSLFSWREGEARPSDYEYVQSGLGSRSRRVHFDWEEDSAILNLDGNSLNLPLEAPVFDELSAHIELKRQLEAGLEEASVTLIDKDRIEEERYRVLGEELVQTQLGNIRAVKLAKLRPPDSERITELWLAPDYDYMLVKLYQRDPEGRELELLLSHATHGGEPVQGS